MSNHRLLVASDLHGSSHAFVKFLDLMEGLRADTGVICGDWSGKHSIFKREVRAGVAVYSNANRWSSEVPAVEQPGMEDAWRLEGYYIVDVIGAPTKLEIAELEAQARARRLRMWLDHAEERLRGTGAGLISIPGNDDEPPVCNVLATHPLVTYVDERVALVDDVEIFGFGYSNYTPWHSPRELPEDQIFDRLQVTFRGITQPKRAVGLIHIPPRGSGLDRAHNVPVVGSSPRAGHGYHGEIPIGSSGARRFIEKNQPLMVLSGHCHESRGVVTIGSTVCVNPGSLYHRHMLSAYLIILDNGRISKPQYFMR